MDLLPRDAELAFFFFKEKKNIIKNLLVFPSHPSLCSFPVPISRCTGFASDAMGRKTAASEWE